MAIIALSKHAAELRTARHKRDFATLKKGWLHLGREVQKSMDLGVPALLGKTMREWMADTFDESASHIFRQLQSYRALKEIPASMLEKISESNAHELTKLNGKDRKIEAVHAMEQKPKQFKETVAKIRKEKYGIEPENWKTFKVRVPASVYDRLITAQEKMHNVLHFVDLEFDDEARPAQLITIWEAIAQLVNGTDETILRTEVEGQ